MGYQFPSTLDLLCEAPRESPRQSASGASSRVPLGWCAQEWWEEGDAGRASTAPVERQTSADGLVLGQHLVATVELPGGMRKWDSLGMCISGRDLLRRHWTFVCQEDGS